MFIYHKILLSLILLLEIHYVTSQTTENRICQGKVRFLHCTEGTSMIIREAYFGRQYASFCKNRKFGTHKYACKEEKVKEIISRKCDNQNSCVVGAIRRHLQQYYDICDGVSKYLYIKRSCINDDLKYIDTKENFCESEERILSCGKNQVIEIKRVFWGRDENEDKCNGWYIQRFWANTCRSWYALGKVQEMCNGKRWCNLVATKNIFGNPGCNSDTALSFKVTYKCVSGKTPVTTMATKKSTVQQTTTSTTMTTKTPNIAKTTRKSTVRTTTTSRPITTKTPDTKNITMEPTTSTVYNTTTITQTPNITTTTTEATVPPTTPSGPIIRQLCENRNMILFCSNDKVIKIRYAFFGNKNAAICATKKVNTTSNTTNDFNCSTDALDYMKYFCQDQSFCYVNAYAGNYGDPCPGVKKYLEFEYECAPKGNTTQPPIMVIPPVPIATLQPNMTKPSAKCGMNYVQSGRVIGGTTPTKGQFPWQVAIYYKGDFICGGSLINSEWIVTAAHCFRSIITKDYQVILGEHDREILEGSEVQHNVKGIFIHWKYNKDDRWSSSITHDYDIALVKLELPAMFNKLIAPICLPDDSYTKDNEECYISGWGKTTFPGQMTGILQHTKVSLVNKRTCQDRLRTAPGKPGDDITSNMFCAQGADKVSTGCHGDSGGPYSCFSNNKWVLRGVVSWGSPRCNIKDMYLVLSNVQELEWWIDYMIDREANTPAPTMTTNNSTVQRNSTSTPMITRTPDTKNITMEPTF